jgi:hypothetical protein
MDHLTLSLDSLLAHGTDLYQYVTFLLQKTFFNRCECFECVFFSEVALRTWYCDSSCSVRCSANGKGNGNEGGADCCVELGSS